MQKYGAVRAQNEKR